MPDGRKPSFDLTELSGYPEREAKERCESEGFTVQLLDLGQSSTASLDYRPGRIRLLTRHGKVVEARQG